MNHDNMKSQFISYYVLPRPEDRRLTSWIVSCSSRCTLALVAFAFSNSSLASSNWLLRCLFSLFKVQLCAFATSNMDCMSAIKPLACANCLCSFFSRSRSPANQKFPISKKLLSSIFWNFLCYRWSR